MEYTIYRMWHPDFPELLYIGSTTDLRDRKWKHKSGNSPVHKFIRDNNIDFETIQFEIISKMHFKTKEHAWKHERYWIESYDAIENGQNEILPWKSKKETLESQKQWQKDNPEKMKEQRRKRIESGKYKKWYYDNYEKIRINSNEKVQCPNCDSKISRQNLQRHIDNMHNNLYQRILEFIRQNPDYYIFFRNDSGKYRVIIKRQELNFSKQFNSKQEAIEARDKVLKDHYSSS